MGQSKDLLGTPEEHESFAVIGVSHIQGTPAAKNGYVCSALSGPFFLRTKNDLQHTT
jgi:hypothetical protein